VKHGRTRSGAAVFVRVSAVKIVVNGQPMDVREGLSVDELLLSVGVTREFTAVAVNREVTPKSAYASTRLREGDRVEIVRPMGGG
jgi:sulfur carrier protein